MDITHDNVCSSMLSCFYSHLLSTGRPISSFLQKLHKNAYISKTVLDRAISMTFMTHRVSLRSSHPNYQEVFVSPNMGLKYGHFEFSNFFAKITKHTKGEKDRQLLKNWRPISLLCVTYKLASSVISNRMKPYLDKIIERSQSGFLSGRNIAESTRLIYDIMHFTEVKNIDGILLLIDFEKAFDSLSWNFMYNVLLYFGFDDQLID